MARCHVVFMPSRHPDRFGPEAVALDRHGRSVNYINYPRGYVITAKEKARARKVLCGPRRKRK